MASRTLLTLAAALCLSLAAGQAAAQDNKRITKDQTKLTLNMPGLESGREIFEYLGWNANYTVETHYAAQVPWSGAYPRAQVYHRRLAGGQVWVTERTIDEAGIRASVPFLRDKKITVPRSDSGGGSREKRLVRFEVDGADCAYFVVIIGGFGTITGERPGNVGGFYCGGLGAKLTEADIAAVLDGWRIKP